MNSPRVTEIIRAAGLGPDYAGVSEEVLAHAAAIGTAAHAAVDMLERGVLIESSVHPLVAPRLEAYRKFVAESGFRRIRTEFEVRSQRWGYHGHPDSLGWLGTERIGIDAKATAVLDVDSTAIQCAGYDIAYAEEHPQAPVSRWFGLHLRDDGTYRFTPLVKTDAKQLFLAALLIYHERARRKGTNGTRTEAA